MKQNYEELKFEIVQLLQVDVITASIPGEGDKEKDPYTSGNNWWET
jgi:hypothetical protein